MTRGGACLCWRSLRAEVTGRWTLRQTIQISLRCASRHKQLTSLLSPPSEADQNGLSDVVEGGEEAGPAGQVEEPLPPRGGGQQPGAERVDQEHADQTSHQPSCIIIKKSF